MSTPRLVTLRIATLSVLLGGCSSDSELESVVADANRMAPALESAVRGTDYPTRLAESKAALSRAKIEPSAGNVVKGYAYDAKTVEFRLCIEGPTGAFAIYDTRPMSLFESGATGGCPSM